MFRLYDTQRREVAEITPVRARLLRVHLAVLGAARPVHIGDLRMYVLADLIRRNAERHASSVIVCQDAADASSLPAADRVALSVAPPDLDCAGPAAPGADDAVDIDVSAMIDAGANGADLPAAHRADAAGASSAAIHADLRHWVRAGPVLFDGQEAPAPGAGAPEATVMLLPDVAARFDPLALRLAFLGERYREQLSLSWDLLAAADADLRRWRELVATWANEPSKPICARYWTSFAEALDDDLDTPSALTALQDLAADREIPAGSKFETFSAADRVLGLELVSLIGKLPA